MKHCFIRIVFLLLLTATMASQQILSQCDITVGKGESATAWDDQFTQNGPGWTGADTTVSVELPNGNTAFFFSDSYIAEDPTKPGDGSVQFNENGLRTRKPNCVPPICGPAPEVIHYVYNSVVVRSKDGKTLRTLTGEKDKFGYSTSFFKPKSTNPNHMYWLGDPIIVDVGGRKKVWIFLNEWDVARPFDKSFWIKYRGQAVAQMDAETLALEKIVDLKNKTDEAIWGISQWLDERSVGKDLYIYGMRNEGDIEGVKKSTLSMADKYKKLYIAKVDASKGLEAVADLNNWNAWDGKAFVKDLSKRKSIIPEKDSISDELTIRKLNIKGKPIFVIVTFDTSVGYSDWKDLYLYSACEPQGPFTTKHHFYRTPTAGQKILPGMTGSESLQSGLSVYNPHMHPQFIENGKLLISYNSNLPFGSKPGDSIYADFYRPRFVWVPIDGLQRK
ncbi:MAG TPA: DUF5005 domain-containing protein [Pyrinomonadaceae bacterium]|nr:DUF5005 domain-containing protein [Pyrinomonadaceae bacterium]